MNVSRGLQILIDAKTKRKEPVTSEQVAEWEYKLKNKIWIEGTPWNIPATDRITIRRHFNDTVNHGKE